MCGRYTIIYKEKEISDTLQVQLDLPFPDHYNATPSTLKNPIPMPVISSAQPGIISYYVWGLVPFFSKESATKYSTINARIETILSSPSYRMPIRKQHCLVLANSYFEWQKTTKGTKQPYTIFHRDTSVFAFAGIWDRWIDAGGTAHYTYSIITAPAFAYIRELHDRMPVIIKPDNYTKWLHPTLPVTDTLDILADNMNTRLNAYPISSAVNSPSHSTPDLLKPIGPLVFAAEAGNRWPQVELKDRH